MKPDYQRKPNPLERKYSRFNDLLRSAAWLAQYRDHGVCCADGLTLEVLDVMAPEAAA